MALPNLPVQGQMAWFTPRNNWDLAVKGEIEGRLSDATLKSTFLEKSRVVGGTTGQSLVKKSSANYDFEWTDATVTTDIATSSDWALSITAADFRAPVGTKLTIPSYVTPSGGETTHPSVVYSSEPWNGYRYWMAHTPYPGGNDDYENPSVVASLDGITWVTPPGLVNPIDAASGDPDYYSDVDMLLGPDGKMYLFWRWDNPATTTERIYMSYSSNGINWSTKKVIHETTYANARLVSPTFIYENNGLTMWAVDIAVSSDRKLVRKRANVSSINDIVNSSWSAATVCTISYMQAGKQPWHFSLRNVNGIYVGVLNDATTNVSGTNGDLFLVTSSDGLNFTSGTNVLIPRSSPGNHDSLYRASLVPEINGSTFGFRVFYSAWLTTTPSVWNIFRTFASSVVAPNSSNDSTTLTLPAGRFTSISKNAIVRKNGWARASLNGITQASSIGAGTELATIPVTYRNLSSNAWVQAWGASGAPVPIYYDIAANRIKNLTAIPASTPLAITIIWDVED